MVIFFLKQFKRSGKQFLQGKFDIQDNSFKQ